MGLNAAWVELRVLIKQKGHDRDAPFLAPDQAKWGIAGSQPRMGTGGAPTPLLLQHLC